MNSRNIWLALCWLFCIFNLKLLIDDWYLISYNIVEKNDDLYDKDVNFLVCTSFETIKSKNQLQFEHLPEKVTVKEFLKYAIRSVEHRLNISNYFKPERSSIFAGRVCFNIDKADLETGVPFSKFGKIYDFLFYIYSNGKHPFSYEYVYVKDDDLDYFVLKIHKQKVFTQRFLDDSNCSTPEQQLASNRFMCLNKCYKRIDRSEFCYYQFDEEGSLNPNLILGEQPTIAANQVHKELLQNLSRRYESCFDQCKESNCFLEIYNTGRVRESYYERFQNEESKEKIFLELTFFKPFYSGVYLFYQQLFGLIALFTGTCVVETSPFLLHLLIKQLKPTYRRRLRPILYKFKSILTILCLIFFVDQSMDMYRVYKFQSNYPNETMIFDFTSAIDAPISVVVCFPIEGLVFNDSKIVRNRNRELVENYTFNEIERMTNRWESKVADVQLTITNRSKLFDYEISDDVLFKSCTFHGVKLLARCFRIEVRIQLFRYKTMMSIFFMNIRFRDPHWKLYVVDRSQPFTTDLYELKGEYYVAKVLMQRSPKSKKSNCTNHANNGELNCRSRKSCIDRCRNKLFYGNYSAIPMNSVVDRNEFDSSILEHAKFIDKYDSLIESDCSTMFGQDCNYVVYIETFRTTYSYSNRSIFLNLGFFKFVRKEMEATVLKLTINIFNLEALLFGSNIASGLCVLSYSLKRKLKSKWYRLYRLLIFAVCFAGFLIHNTFVFQSIINSDLVENGFFKMVEDYKLPNIIYCVPYDKRKVDKNHKMTGRYLDDVITKHLNYAALFEKIVYFSEGNLKVYQISNRTTSFENEIYLNHFYFYHLKCFEIEFKVLINEEDLFFTPGKIILAVHFNKQLYNLTNHIFFSYRTSESKQISGNYRFKIGPSNSIPNMYHKHELVFENFEIKQEDRFELLKINLFKNLFYKKTDLNEVDEYLKNIKETFETNYDITTRHILLEKDAFGRAIENELFKQYYVQGEFNRGCV